MIQSVTFTHDIDRSYLLNIKKSKRSIRQTKSQNFLTKIQKMEDDELIRKNCYSDDEFQEENQNTVKTVVDTVTDTVGLKQLLEFQEKQREMKKLDQQNIYKNSNTNVPHHFSPTPPKVPVPPKRRRRSIPVHSMKIKIQNDELC